MTLKKILAEESEKEIIKALIEMYPECKDQVEDYIEVLHKLKNLPAKNVSDFVIKVGLIDPSQSEDYEEDYDEVAYLSILGYSVKESMEFVLSFTQWDEWVNATILLDEGLEISESELVALCLFEMTFYGFDEKSINQALKEFETGISQEPHFH